MGNMRTLAFQVPEDLFQKIKNYLQHNNLTQKDFVIGLIEKEIDRDLTQRAAINEVHTESEEMSEEQKEAQKTAAVSDCEVVLEEAEEDYGEQENDDFLEDFEVEEELNEADEQCEDEDIIEEQEESDGLVMSMGM